MGETMKVRGKAWKYPDNVDTDQIIAGRYCNTSDPAELAEHCMEDIDSDFRLKISPGDIIVAGSNFGCGSSRELAPIAIKASGISCVIAQSFARIFFRNSVNIGLPVFECPECVQQIEEGDELEVEPSSGNMKDLTKNLTFRALPVPPFVQQIRERGGLMAYLAYKIQVGRQKEDVGEASTRKRNPS